MSEPLDYQNGLEAFLSSLPPRLSNQAGVMVRILPPAGHINVRGEPGNTDFIATVNATLGQALPVCANTLSNGDHQIFWLGPDEWLVVTPLANTAGLIERLRGAMAGLRTAVTDVSGGQVNLRIHGPDTMNLLARGCTLDFHPARFKVGSCAQTGLAGVNCLIGLHDDEPSFTISVRRSFAEHLVRWLHHSGSEYGIHLSS